MSSDILPYVRKGAWSSPHSFYYQCAYKSLDRYREVLNLLETKEQEIRDSNQNEDPRVLSTIINFGTIELNDECYREATSTLLFACMTLEGFLNHYGVRRLGELFYKKNIERVGITEKVSILILTCCHKSIGQDSNLIKKTRDLFDARNQLVHPKSREIHSQNLDEFVRNHPRDIPIDKHVMDMESIIDELYKLDKNIIRELDFRKHQKIN